MTRVNVGILPSELCDQMLLAEIRELPRCFAYPENHPRAPKEFTLGTGHVLWCANHKLSLWDRLVWLRDEATSRGFSSGAYPEQDLTGRPFSMWNFCDWTHATPLLIARISERLTQMKREPRWTNRQPPEWALPALEQRKKDK